MGNCTSADAAVTGPTRYRLDGQPPPSMTVQTPAKGMTNHSSPIVVNSPNKALGPSPQVVYRPVPIVYSGATAELCCGGHCVMVKYPGGKCQSTCIDCYGGAGGFAPRTNEGHAAAYGSPVRTQ